MKLLYIIAAMAVIAGSSCQRKASLSASVNSTITTSNPVLLGKHTKKDLQQAPYKAWFDTTYASYSIDSSTADQLKPLVKDKSYEIFMGTWCGDSRREVPRMLKILEYAGVKPSQIQLIMLGNKDSSYKQSPGHEEKGKGIHRVPDLVVYENKKEMNRIVESPVISLEKDLLSIVQGAAYQPNYKAAAWLLPVLQTKSMEQLISDNASIIRELKERVKNSAELNTVGYVLMSAGELEKALLVFECNAAIYPQVANVYDSLGEINLKLHKKDLAIKYYRKVLEMQPDDSNAKKMLSLLN